jgi:eukaryotic-like serine/threonine-protein kinase
VTSNPHFEVDDSAEAAVRVGRTLRDKWRLDTLIDVGGMAAVYAATHRNGMRGAVKILHLHRSRDPDIAARFRREGYIANKVAHPNAVSVLDDDVDEDGSVFLVMELLEGSTLRDRAAAGGGRLPADEVLLAMDQLLDVLAAAHDAAIIHRDIKPENVFVTVDGTVKILDFGIARLSEPSAVGHSATMAGLPMGSPAFMSPEQARGRWDLVGEQSDVWSVGATMFTLLAGEDVHVEGTVPELLAAIFTQPARSLATVAPGSHPALVDVVDRALQLHLADRWPTARAMQAAVREAYAAIYGEPLPPKTLGTQDPHPTVISQDAMASGGQRRVLSATTVVGAEGEESKHGWRRRNVRRAALALAIALAGVLGITGVHHDARSDETVRSMAPEARRSDLPPGTPMARLSSPSVAEPLPDLQPTPIATATQTPLAPVTRVRRRSIYDRRH